MTQITRLKFQKNKKRVNVYLDGKFALGLPAETLVKAGLAVNQELTENEIEKLRNKDSKAKAFNRALKFLSYRPRSEKEVIDYLAKNKTGKDHISRVLKKLKRLKFLDDEAFADWWLEQRASFRPRGKKGLIFELKQKGIDSKLAEKIIKEKVDELPLAKKAAQKKQKVFQKLNDQEFRKKMTAFLARRGFSWETIKKVLEEIRKKE